MSEQFDTGGPAYPVNTANIHNPGACLADEGATMWDYYAKNAMAACITWTTAHPRQWLPPEEVAKEAGLYADAMIAERKRRMGRGES